MIKVNTITKHFIVYLIGVFLINSVGFFLIPIYTKYLSTSEFGILEIVNRSLEIANIIFAAGLGITSLSFYSSEQDQSKKNAAISTAILMIGIFSLLGMIIFQALAIPLSTYFFGTSQFDFLFRLVGVIIVVELLSIVPLAYLQACMNSTLYVTISVCRFVIIIGFNILFVAVLNLKLNGVIAANIIGYSIFTIFLLIYTLRKTGIYFDKHIFNKMISFAIPFVPGGLFFFVLNNGDRFFIQKFLGSSTVGVYSLSYKISTIAMVFVLGPFLKIWGPYMFKLKEVDDNKLFGNFFLYLIFAYCITSLPLALFSKEILKIVANENYLEGHKIIPFVLVAYLFWSAAAFFDSSFYITRKTFYKPYIMGFATILAFALYWFLIPIYGILGGAYATTICFGAFSLLTYFISSKIFLVAYPLNKALYMIVLGIIIYIFSIVLPENNLIITVLTKATLVVIYPILIVVTGILDYRDLYRLKGLIGLKE